MVKGRIIGEAIVISVSAIILLVILGLRYISESTGTSSSSGLATSSLFLTLLFFLIVCAIAIIEVLLRVRERRGSL